MNTIKPFPYTIFDFTCGFAWVGIGFVNLKVIFVYLRKTVLISEMRGTPCPFL